jgi:hypothetical protein
MSLRTSCSLLPQNEQYSTRPPVEPLRTLSGISNLDETDDVSADLKPHDGYSTKSDDNKMTGIAQRQQSSDQRDQAVAATAR